MKKVISNARPVLCGLILLSFFLPAYAGYSAIRFSMLALAEASGKNNVTTTDVAILVLPLLLIPATAIGFCLLFLLHQSIRRIYLALPIIFLVFFLALLFNSPGLAAGRFTEMQAGFYLMSVSACLLPFTTDAKRKRRRRRRHSSATVVATA